MTNKIKLARKLRGLSMDDLVERMGRYVSKMSISKYERGIVVPNDEFLAKISEACNLPLNFFHEEPLTFGELSFRIDKDAEYLLDDDLKMIILEKVEEYLHAEQLACSQIEFKNQFSGRIIRDYADIENAALRLRGIWELGKQPIVSVYELLELNGIKIIEFYYEDKNVNGVSFFVNGNIPCMLINTYINKTVERKRFTALHELAHLLFDIQPISAEEYAKQEHTTSHHPPTVERLANRFAGAMLLPAEVVKKRVGEKRETIAIEELISIRNRYGVSISAQCYRLLDVGIITLDYRNKLYDEVINPNFMEVGWGSYPIPEIADRLDIFGVRNKLN